MTAPTAAPVPVEGYASLFWTRDLADDVVARGAFADSLTLRPGPLAMLHQHDVREPVGVWDEVREDARGLYVKGRVLTDTTRGRLAGALVKAGALDGLSIGFRTRKARSAEGGRVRVLSAVDLWEVSLVRAPMLPGGAVAAGVRARIAGSGGGHYRYRMSPRRAALFTAIVSLGYWIVLSFPAGLIVILHGDCPLDIRSNGPAQRFAQQRAIS